MTIDEVKIELARWGNYQRLRYVREQRTDDGGPDSHPLSRARQFAPGTRENAAKLLAGRDGRSRRRWMAQNGAAVAGSDIAPTWACDPVPCTDTRNLGPVSAAFDRGIPPGYEWVDAALRTLSRTNPMQAIVVRKEFTVDASQGAKARMAAEEARHPLSKWQYRRELALGLSFIAGQRS